MMVQKNKNEKTHILDSTWCNATIKPTWGKKRCRAFTFQRVLVNKSLQ